MPLKINNDEQPTLNLTPMIDVVFLLIIFFMVGTQFTSEERNITLKVPQVGNTTQLSPATEKRVVNVFADGSITLDQQPVTLAGLVEQLSRLEQQGAAGVTVRGDAEGSFQSVASVLSACREAGIRDMAISVRLARRPE